MSFVTQELEMQCISNARARTNHIIRLLYFLFKFMPYATKVLLTTDVKTIIDHFHDGGAQLRRKQQQHY